MRIAQPVWSRTMRDWLSSTIVELSSHSLPKLIRLLVNPSMMYPVRAALERVDGRERRAPVVEVLHSPVAVWITVRGTVVLAATGAAGVR